MNSFGNSAIGVQSSSNNYYFNYGTVGSRTTQPIVINQWHKIVVDNNKFYVDDVLVDTRDNEFINTDVPLYFNGCRANSSTDLYSSRNRKRTRNLKIWQGGVLVRDFVSCVDTAGTPCQYDKVTGQTFYYQGSAPEFSY